ncbi:MAG: MarR family winged helix-turn-helix transcriptional regulator [Promethearchaeota archaeon]
MTMEDLFMELFYLVKKVEKQFNKIERKLLQERPKIDKKNITPPQFFVLRILWYQDGFPLNHLAKLARCSRSTMTGIIDTMEKNGLIKRIPNPKDGRSTLVKLTNVGRELRHYAPPLDTYMMEHCETFSKEELQMLILLLKKFLKCLGSNDL